MFSVLNSLVEKAIGSSKLNLTHRRELMATQINTLVEMVPAMVIGCFAIIAILLITGRSFEYYNYLITWSLVLGAIQLAGLWNWLKTRKKPKATSVSLTAIRSATLQSTLLGSTWAVLPIMIFSGSNIDLKLLTTVALVGVLCGSGFALAVIPQAVIGFITPLSMGILAGLFLNPDFAHAYATSLMLLAFLLIIPSITLQYARNFTRQITTEQAMREQKNIIGLLLNEYEENASDWLWEVGLDGRLLRSSTRLLQACRIDIETEVTEFNFLDFLKANATNPVILKKLETLLGGKKSFRDFDFPMDINGDQVWWKLIGKPVFDGTGQFCGYMGIGSDCTAEKTAENKISKLAHCDVLTGLLNRASFSEVMNGAIANLERYGSPFGVMFLDLDKFKLVNDTRGHLVGDELLKQVSKRITAIVGNQGKVARLGGDEFAIILTENGDAGNAAKLGGLLINEINKHFEIDGERHSIGVSIGIALAPMNGTRTEQLLRNADLALYRSKSDGRGVFRFFESQMDADEREKRMLEIELKSAIENNEFELLYQPLISTETGLPTTMEALIRWHHPMRGTVSPVEFIPIAEQSPLIQEIGSWSIKRACAAAMEWPNEVAVAVNLSAQHFVGADIVAVTRNALEATGLDPKRLELEITESLLINNTEEVLKILSQLKELGVSIALDDFGTGYSSLSYIMKFPFDKIKIDRSFVKASSDDDAAKAILRMISSLGASLNIRITAEGVETEEQVTFLKSINCQQFQGFLFAKPLKSGDLESFFQENTAKLSKLASMSDPKQSTQYVA